MCEIIPLIALPKQSVPCLMTCATNRTHKLFIITSGGCGNLADKFYNYSVDIRGSTMSTEDVMELEEAYYLR